MSGMLQQEQMETQQEKITHSVHLSEEAHPFILQAVWSGETKSSFKIENAKHVL